MERRDYDPAVVIHVADCDEAPADPGMIYPARAMQAYPNGRPHQCFQREAITRNAPSIVERVEYERHDYVPSTIFPDDATRPLCRTCRGTHGDETPQESTPSGLPRRPNLIVPR